MRGGQIAAIGTYAQLHTLLPDLVAAAAAATEQHGAEQKASAADEKAPAEGKAALTSPEERFQGAVSWQVYRHCA